MPIHHGSFHFAASGVVIAAVPEQYLWHERSCLASTWCLGARSRCIRARRTSSSFGATRARRVGGPARCGRRGRAGERRASALLPSCAGSAGIGCESGAQERMVGHGDRHALSAEAEAEPGRPAGGDAKAGPLLRGSSLSAACAVSAPHRAGRRRGGGLSCSGAAAALLCREPARARQASPPVTRSRHNSASGLRYY